jgi:LDH2 family malate/lactate/ureidoglycolate dehydrogenase
LIPGDPEREMEAQRKVNGIPLLKAVVDDLQYLAERFEIDLSGFTSSTLKQVDQI